MTNSPDRDNEPEISANRRIWLLWLSRSGLALGVILLVGIAAGAWWAWIFVHEQLGPIVEKNLTKSLNRPVKLGKVEQFSLTGLRFGASEILPTPTDPDSAKVQAVDVTFDLLQLLLDRTLALNVALVNPNIYIEQDRDGRWITLEVQPPEPGAAFKTEIESVRVQNANVVLVPYPETPTPKIPFTIPQANGLLQVRENNQRFRFEFGGQLANGGNFNLEGEHLLPAQQTNFQQVKGQNLPAAELDRLFKLPVNVQSGLLDADLQVKYNPTQPISAFGTARLQGVTASLPQLPTPFFNTTGTVLFQDQVVRLQNVTTSLGQIPLILGGGLHLEKGYDVTAKVPNTEVAKVAQSLNFKPPVALNGAVQADLRVTGAIAQPLLIGQFATTRPTQVDRVNFSTISGRFALATNAGELVVANLVAKPVVGGEITGKGQVKLGTQGGLVFDLQAQNVPGDAIAQIYGANLSPSIKIGPVQARAQVFGPFNDLRTVARWRSPQATFAGTGEVVIARGQTVLRDTTFNIGGGTVQTAARIANGNWEAVVEGSQVPISRLLALQATGEQGQQQLPPAIQQGIFTGRARLAGTTASFQAKDIRAIAQGRIQVAGGTLQIQQAGLNQGNWEAVVAASGVQLARLLPPEQVQNLPVQPGAFTGSARLAGNIDSFQAKDIRALAQGNLQVAGGTVQIQQAGLNQGNWEAVVAASGVQLARLLPPEQLQSLPVQPGVFSGRARLSGNIDSFQAKDIRALAQGNLQVAGGTVQIQQAGLNQGNWEAVVTASQIQTSRLLTPEQRRNLPVPLGQLSGRARLAGNIDSFQLANIRGVAQGQVQVGGGTVQIPQAAIANGNWEAVVAASGVPLGNFPQVPPQFQRGQFNGQFRLAGNLESFELANIRGLGSGNVQIAGGNLQIRQVEVANNRWQAFVSASQLQLARLLTPQQARNLPLQQGIITGQARLEGSLDSFQPATIQAVAQGSIQTGRGSVQIRQAELSQGRWQALLDAAGVQLSAFAQVPPAVFSGRVQAAGSIDSFQAKDIQAVAQGNLNIAGGTVQIQRAELSQGRWQAAFNTAGVQLHRLAQLPNRLQAVFSGQVQAAGTTESFQARDIQATAQGNLNVAGGTVQIQRAQLSQGRWQAAIAASNLQLSRVSQELRGRFSTENLRLAGSLDAPTPANIQAAGQVNLSDGVSFINGPLNASIQWNGQQLRVAQATAPGFSASGVIDARFNAAGTPQITNLNLNVGAQDLNLQALPLTLPNNVALAGRADFSGQISGTPTNPNVNGDIQLRNLVVNNLDFEPVLTGRVVSPERGGIQLNVAGQRDRITLALNPNNQPESFFVQRDGAVAEGTRQGDRLLATVRNFPLSLARSVVTLPPAIANQQVAGTLSGNFAINLNDFSVIGENVAIAEARIGPLQGYQIAGGNFRYNNGVLEIAGGELQQGDSRYAVVGRLTQTQAGPQFQGEIKVSQGKIQEVFKVARLFNLLDFQRGGGTAYARAAAVQVNPVGVAGERLQTQLRRFSEIEALRQQERDRRREESPLPQLEDLTNLQGTFSGAINVAGTPTSGLRGVTLNFNLQGQNWVLEEFKADRVILQGSLDNGVLAVAPLRIESGQTLVAFSGTLGLQQQAGQLTVQNFPVAVLRRFVPLPFDLTGNLNANATLSGNLDNPQINGDAALVGGTLNQTPVQNAQASFNYDNARLNFNSQILATGTEPIQIQGSVPYQLPFSSVTPDSDRIALDLNVQNDGLALLNLLTRQQVQWVTGQGQVQLQVRGTLEQPVATGLATVDNATLRAQVLQDEPLTGVTGRIRFDFDRVQVESLQGQYSRGQVAAQGVIPISRPIPGLANPLTVTLNQLALNLRGLYQGQANGSVVIRGTALNPETPPELGGQVELTNGRVFLSAAGSAPTAGATAGGTGGRDTSAAVPEFNDLRLTLGQGVAISQPPILNFQATGDLTLNGPLNNIAPQGLIRLRRGEVNLFAARFTLARGDENTAEFLPDRGLDPLLNVRLVSNVSEVTRSRLPSTNVASEISDEPSTAFGATQTVRVQARINGPASQLTDNLELTSNPPRSREEIVALIGGGFIQTLGQGTDSTLGLANLAGSVVLSGFQDTITSIGQAVGLSELRLFPTIITSERARDSSNSVLGLAAEAGIDISRNLSASILRVLTSDQPTQFNLRYRVNREILLRGSTDFSGDSRAVVEFERRF